MVPTRSPCTNEPTTVVILLY
uniref:Uncharacterized protein n=1 Tax=Anguilla anguilla TaxID=7936 RepID=A0A0E9TK83_ANGAN